MTIDLTDRQELSQAVQELGLELEPGQFDRLTRYCLLLKDWNTRINLVSRKDIANLVPNHVVDSLVALPLLRSFAGQRTVADPLRVMDLGSGGGFPGIPLKICLTAMRITFVEATQKKAKFIELAVTELGLADATVIARHSSELTKDTAHRAGYDVVVTRAVAELKELVKISFPFLKPGGRMLAYKAGKAEAEIADADAVIRKYDGLVEHGAVIRAPQSGTQRRIVVVRKKPAL